MQIFSEATSELLDHALLIKNVLLSEASEFLKLSIVLIHGHAALLEIVELLMLTLTNTLWNVMSFEVSAEIILGNHTTSSGISVLLIPLNSLVFELKRSELDKVLRPDIATFKMLVDVHEPIIGIRGLGTVAERLGLICEKLVESSEVRLIVALALISLIALPLGAFLQELQNHLSIGVGGCHDSLPCLRRRRWWRRVRLTPFIAIRILTRWRSHPEEGDIR